jgi:osmotically-inducible protein OsmY
MASASPASTNTPAPRAEPTVGTGRGQYTEEQARQERERAFGNKETIGQSLDDAWIHTKIVAKLIGDKTTPERNINVDVVEGTVTLRGNVDTADAKTEAERVAKDTEGVTKVINQLKVVASKTGNANKTVNPNTNKQKTSY